MDMNCCVNHHKSSEKKCPLSGKNEKKNLPCDNNGCNPFMPCSIGNFYIAVKLHFLSVPIDQSGINNIPLNDNRTAKSLSECWHPPRKS